MLARRRLRRQNFSRARPLGASLNVPTVANPGEGPPTLFLDQTEAQRAEKTFFGDRPPPPFSHGLVDRPFPPPPPPLSESLDPPLSYTSGSVHMFQNSEHPEIRQMIGKKTFYSLGLGATSHFTYCQVFWVVRGFLGQFRCSPF